jgi:phenylalanyl-tRNA synthetase beta chain
VKISLNWLRRWLPTLEKSAERINEALVSMGIGVESWHCTGLPQQLLVVGEILSIQKHPNGDRLRLCLVNDGSGEARQIVCGATNFHEHDRVPLALPGCIMPSGLRIECSELRGVLSRGMMCSGRELGLGVDHSGLLILDHNTPVGTPLWELFPDAGDIIFDLEITANRGDCMSHLGIARELSAYFQIPLNEITFPKLEHLSVPTESLLKNLSLESDNCEQFIAWGIRDVQVGESPQWLKDDLEKIGMRSINNVVDITNWVLWDLGQPLHAFDLAKIHGQHLHIRQARDGERITALNHKTYSLSPQMLVIGDDKAPLVIGGIMGSVDAEVDQNTKNVVLESAVFSPSSIQRTARQLGIITDASQHFSRGVDAHCSLYAAQRAISLMEQICGGKADTAPVVAVHTRQIQQMKPIYLCEKSLRREFSVPFTNEELVQIFQRLHFSITPDGNGWSIQVPSFRSNDVREPHDLVEEFVRLYGIEKLGKMDVISKATENDHHKSFIFQRVVGDLLSSLGYDECYNYSTRSPKEICDFFGEEWERQLAITNPLSNEQSHLRPSLLPALVETFHYNLCNGNDTKKFFEIGRIWRVYDDKIYEAIAVAWIQSGEATREAWDAYNPPNFYDMKAIGAKIAAHGHVSLNNSQFFQPLNQNLWQSGHSAQFGRLPQFSHEFQVGLMNLKTLNNIGIRNPIFGGEWVFLPSHFQRKEKMKHFQPFGTFPAVSRDLAVITDLCRPAENVRQCVEKYIRKSIPKDMKLSSLYIFDIYIGDEIPFGKKSIGFRFTLERDDRTIGEEEIRKIFETILNHAMESGELEIRMQQYTPSTCAPTSL